jgi:WD40 repeat protein
MKRICGFVFLISATAYGADAPSFAKDIAPILANRCSGCHAASAHMGSLNLETFEGLMTGGKHGQAIVPGNAAESRLYLMLTAKITPAMPMDGTKLSDGEIRFIKEWIDAGAKPPAPGEALPMAASATAHIEPQKTVKPQIYDLAYSPDGKSLALAGFREVRIVDVASKRQTGVVHTVDAVRAVAFSKDGRLLAAAGGLPARSGEIVIFEMEHQRPLRTIKGHADCIYGLSFSPDGKMLATSSYDKLIKLWDVETGKEIRTLKDHIDAIYALAFTPDGKRLVSGAADRTVKIWNVETGERLYTLSEPQDGINSVVLDPTGTMVAAAGLDKTIRVWTLGEKEGKLKASAIAHEDAILRLAWSPDGKTLLSSSADRTVKLLRAADLTEIEALPPQPDWVYGLGFSPDGKTFAAGRFDGSLAIYDNVPANSSRASR